MAKQRRKEFHLYEVSVISRHTLTKQTVRIQASNAKEAKERAKREYGKVLKVGKRIY